MATPVEVNAALAYADAALPRSEGSEAQTQVYAELLADIPGDVLVAAIKDVLARCKFYPTVAEIRDAAFAILENRLGIPSAPEAWGEVSGGMRDSLATRCPSFSHPVIRRVVNAVGGWYALCTSENATADRARFLEAYEQITARDREQRRMLPEVRALAQRLQDERAALPGTAPVGALAERLRLGDGQN